MATTVETFANQPSTTVSSGGTTAPASGTPESWTVASSSSFPAANSGASPPTQFHVADTALGMTGEIIAVTNVSGTTWTVTRGAESTATAAHAAGFTIVQVVSAGALGGMLQSASNLSDVATRQAALNNLAGAVTSGNYLRGSGSNVAMSAIQAADLPGASTSTQGAVILDGTAGDIAALGTQAAGAVGKAADAGHVHPATGVALLASPNQFTGNPQQVGTSFASGQVELFSSGQIVMASNGAAPPTNAPPAVKFYGYCGGAAGNNGWDMGIDVVNHGGGQDFYFGKVVNGGTQDLWYWNYSSGCLGMGSATPPDDTHLMQIRSQPSTSVGTLKLDQGGSNTGNMLTISASSGIPQIWVDSGMWVNTVAGGAGLQVRGDATNDIGITVSNNAKTKQYTLSSLNSGNVFELKYATGAISNFWGHTDGSVEFLHNIKMNGGIQANHTIKFANYTATSGDFIIGCNTSGGAFTITLPSPPSSSQLYIIKDESASAGANNITVSAGAKTIDGAATKVINANYGVIRAYTDGSNWFTW